MKNQAVVLNLIFFLILNFSFACSNTGNEKIFGTITVEAGDFDRLNIPVRYECDLNEIIGVELIPDGHYLVLKEKGLKGKEIPVQWEPLTRFPWEEPGSKGNLVWIEEGSLSKGSVRTYELALKAGEENQDPFTLQDIDNKSILVKKDNKPVLQYNYGIIQESKGQDGIFDKGAYIHPVWTPDGDIITGDFSPEHKWQRGIFLAWEKVKFGDIETNFWELGKATGRTLKDDADPDKMSGPVFSELVVHNKGTVEGKTFFREKCIVRLYNTPDKETWMFDISFRQWPVDPENPEILPAELKVMELIKVHYGGMSFRGVSPGWLHYDFIAKNKEQLLLFDKDTRWLNPADSLDIITSEGLSRKQGNAMPARWIDYTGPLAGGWGGLVMFDNPLNLRYPTPMRIHPDMPYFCFAFAKDSSYSITSRNPLNLHYRVIVHGGHPDVAANEKYARDFTDPPLVTYKPGD